MIFMSPEALFCGTAWKQILSTDLYRENLVGMGPLCEEMVRCIVHSNLSCNDNKLHWFTGDIFRKEFSQLSEVRSIVPDTVNLMALTATATLATRKYVISNLCMQRPYIVDVPPAKCNITYYVGDKPPGGIATAFKPICKTLLENKRMDRVLIFCRSYQDVIGYTSFSNCLWEIMGRIHPIHQIM